MAIVQNRRMEKVFYIQDIDSNSISMERQKTLVLLSEVIEKKWIHEVGSTAVNGVIGKQDLDFLVLVPSVDFTGARQRLDTQFKRNPSQLSNECYQGYTVESTLDVAIQLTVVDGPYDNFLKFLERLRAEPELRTQYNQLKRAHHGKSMRRYQDAKATFIHEALNED